MLIIGKNRDYYDGVVGSTGVDKTIVYERHTNEYDDNDKFPKEFRSRKHYRDEETKFIDLCHFGIDREKTKKYLESDVFYVGFCGKIYVGWKLYYKVGKGFYEKIKCDIIYDIETAKKYLKDLRWSSENLNDLLKQINDYDPINIFREYNTPIFIYDHYVNRTSVERYWGGSGSNQRFIVNPVLKDYEFYKVFETYSAFQEIQMFISGVLGTNNKDIIEVEDKYKIAQHGFDKWSFRKEPTKHKK